MADSIQDRDLRILFWDIDGTLLRSTRVGGFKEYTIPVLEAVFGTAGRLPEMVVSGMTDMQILVEALRDEGFTREQVREKLEDLRDHYLLEIEELISAGEQLFELLPGVEDTLEVLYHHPRYRSALLTGNIEPAARLKIRLFDLTRYFDLPGALAIVTAGEDSVGTT